MRNSDFIVVLSILFIFVGCTEKTNGQTPEAVKTSFQNKYPGENDPDWEVDSNGNYESHFKIKGIKYRADFKPDGSWIETETSIDEKDLPKPIKARIEKEFDGKITEIEKVNHHSKGTFYDVEFKQKGEKKDIEFRANGEIIN